MHGAIIIDHAEFARMPISELEKPLHEKCVAIKVITGYGFDNKKTRISNIYGHEFAFGLYRQKAAMGSIRYKEFMKLFPDAVRGQTIDVWHIFEFQLWDYTGTRSIYQKLFWIESHSDPIPREVMTEIDNAMQKYSDGKLNCSDCGKNIDIDTNNRYFAGSYCDDCWLGRTGKYKDGGGWQKIEAEETYD